MNKDELKNLLNECFRLSYLRSALIKCGADSYLDEWYSDSISKKVNDLISALTLAGNEQTRKLLELAEE